MTVEELRQAQPNLTETFQQILEAGRLNHAYLFSGTFSCPRVSFVRIVREFGPAVLAGPVA